MFGDLSAIKHGASRCMLKVSLVSGPKAVQAMLTRLRFIIMRKANVSDNVKISESLIETFVEKLNIN